MKHLRTFPLLLLLALAATAPTAHAQVTFLIGPRGGIDFGNDFQNDFMVGGDARISAFPLPVIINPAVDYILADAPDVNSALHLDLNALLPFGINNQLFTPYTGLGLGITRVNREVTDSDTDAGLNIVGGAVFGFAGFRPFLQARIKLLGDFELFSVQGGLLFGLGG